MPHLGKGARVIIAEAQHPGKWALAGGLCVIAVLLVR